MTTSFEMQALGSSSTYLSGLGREYTRLQDIHSALFYKKFKLYSAPVDGSFIWLASFVPDLNQHRQPGSEYTYYTESSIHLRSSLKLTINKDPASQTITILAQLVLVPLDAEDKPGAYKQSSHEFHAYAGPEDSERSRVDLVTDPLTREDTIYLLRYEESPDGNNPSRDCVLL